MGPPYKYPPPGRLDDLMTILAGPVGLFAVLTLSLVVYLFILILGWLSVV